MDVAAILKKGDHLNNLQSRLYRRFHIKFDVSWHSSFSEDVISRFNDKVKFAFHYICVRKILKKNRRDGSGSSKTLISALTLDLFVLRFYGSVNPMGSCRARSVYLTTRLLGRLSSLSG